MLYNNTFLVLFDMQRAKCSILDCLISKMVFSVKRQFFQTKLNVINISARVRLLSELTISFKRFYSEKSLFCKLRFCRTFLKSL